MWLERFISRRNVLSFPNYRNRICLYNTRKFLHFLEISTVALVCVLPDFLLYVTVLPSATWFLELAASSFMYGLIYFFYCYDKIPRPWPPALAWHHPQWSRPSHVNQESRKYTTDLPSGQSQMGILSSQGTLLPDDPSLNQVDNNLIRTLTEPACQSGKVILFPLSMIWLPGIT